MELKAVTVTKVDQGSGNWQWYLDLGNGVGGGPTNYPPINVAYGSSPDFSVTISNTSNLTFAADPIWIKSGTTKPTSKVIDGITNVAGGGTKTLTFHDPNAKAEQLYYILRFSDGSTLDPVIKNGGGGKIRPMSAEWLAIGAIAAVVLLFLGWRAFRRKNQVSDHYE